MNPIDNKTLAELSTWLEGQNDFVFLESSRVTDDNHCSMLFHSPADWLVCMPGDDCFSFMARVDEHLRQGRYVAGWIDFEFGYMLEPRLQRLVSENLLKSDRPLAVLGLFGVPLEYDHLQECFRNGTGWPSCKAQDTTFSCTELTPSLTQKQYVEALTRLKRYLLAGDTYQVNYTFQLDFDYQGSIAALYQSLRRNQSVSYGAWIRHDGLDILSFSPELFFTADRQGIRVRPMKGTMSRGRTTAEDLERSNFLASDTKNRCENVMIVDLLRNDLGRLMQTLGGGRVVPQSLFDVETYQSLLQMTSTIDAFPGNGQLPSFSKLFAALFPCGSVTGAPKVHTMEIIHELEQQERGVYCGAIGYAGPDRYCFNVPIRTLELSGRKGKMGIGSAIVIDSDTDAEWQECLLKGKFLTSYVNAFQLIETLLWRPGKGYWLLEYHLDRLLDSASYFSFSADRNVLKKRLERKAYAFTRKMRVRLLLDNDGRIEITAADVVSSCAPSTVPMVVFSSCRVDENSPFLFHKTTRRELFDQEYTRGLSSGYADILFVNSKGQVTEGAISNIFIADQGMLYTPPVQCGLLGGTFRRHLFEQGRVKERILTTADIHGAEQLYLGNSVRGLVPVQLEENEDV